MGYLTLFYFTKASIDLWNIVELSQDVSYEYAPNNLYVYYHANNFWRWIGLRERDLDRFEPAQRGRIDESQPASAFAIEHLVFAWPELLPFLKLVLARYGGWVGCDDGTFERVYTTEDIEELDHPFRDGFKRVSPRPASKPGDRIMIDPSIPQPATVFNLVTYREFLRQTRRLREEQNRLHQVILSYPKKERPEIPEWKQFDVVRDQFRLMTREYHSHLPIRLLAQCPYCGVHILQPVDSFSLMGFDGNLNAIKAYGNGEPQWPSPLPAQRCKHALCATLSVNLNGLKPNDVAGWMLSDKLSNRMGPMESTPRVMVWPLLARHTSAVVHALPIGRLDDEEPIHHYTAYFTTYFVGENSNLYGQMWAPTEFGGPAVGAVQVDVDLPKWIRAGRLYWLDPNDTSRLVKGPPEAFPYTNVGPKGWYRILEGGQLEGPNPYYQVWQGNPPSHDESFPRSIE